MPWRQHEPRWSSARQHCTIPSPGRAVPTKHNDAFYAAGATTIEVKDFYQRYAVDWSTAWGNLAQVANNKVTHRGPQRR